MSLAQTIDTNLFPLGLIQPTPGTPLGVLENFPDLADSDDLYISLIQFQSHPDNTGKCYIGSPTLNVATAEGIVYILMTAGDFYSFSTTGGINPIMLRGFRVDVASPGDGVFVSIYVR